jgi:hypothetical protein
MIGVLVAWSQAIGRRWRLLAGIAGGAFGLSILYFLVSGLMTPDLVPASKAQAISVTRISGQGLREGHTSWRFAAERADFSVDGAVQTYHNATATYYLRGRPTYRIVAGEISVDSRSSNYSADKGVHVWSVGLLEKQHFISQALSWNNGTQTLTSPGTTDLLYHGIAIKTNHMSANLITGLVTLGQSIANVGASSPTPPSTSR